MPLFTLGLNHKTAPLALRETVGFMENELPDALHALHAHADEVSIISTCNRTELYALAADPKPILNWWAKSRGVSVAELAQHSYQYHDRDCVAHIMRVAAGMDSMVLGEPQILGQLKDSHALALAQGSSGPVLTRLHEHAFSLAKLVRSQTGIGANPVSVAFAAVSLAKRIFTDFSQLTGLIIGAGEMPRLAAQHLESAGIGRLLFANRTLERAQELATRHHGFAIPMADLERHLGVADLILSCTASSGYLVTRKQMRLALKGRRHRPVLMLDLAVPRDIEPALAELEDVYLYAVDDLNNVVTENLRSREAAALAAREMIETRADAYLRWLHTRPAAGVIHDIRQRAQAQAEEVGRRAQRMLENGKSPQAALAFMQRGLLNKLLHAPSVALREASPEQRAELSRALAQLFAVTPEDEPPAQQPPKAEP